jgi:hypothetical protein
MKFSLSFILSFVLGLAVILGVFALIDVLLHFNVEMIKDALPELKFKE